MTARIELDSLLDADATACDIERQDSESLSDRFVSNLVIFGAGNLGRVVLAGLRKMPAVPLAFADNSPRLQGTTIQGIPVLSPDEAVARHNDAATFVIAIWGGSIRHEPVRSQLRGLGCRRVVSFASLFCKYPEAFLPFYAFDLPHRALAHAAEIREAFSLLSDQPSRHEFVAQLRWRLRRDFDGLPPMARESQYFCDSLFRPADREVFVDCGAFDGDTLKSFLERQGESFELYFALEPDPTNCEKLRAYVATLPPAIASKVSVMEVATGAERARVRFDATASISSSVDRGSSAHAYAWLGIDPTADPPAAGTGPMEVDCVALDELLGGCVPTTIKMDIEGSEFDTLRGARRSIRSHAPLVAACLYHHQHHLWTIPLLLHEDFPGYDLFLRRHHEDLELVCYAVPPGRRTGRTAAADGGRTGNPGASDDA